MFLIPEQIELIGEGEYNLNVVKKIDVTDSYLAFDQNFRQCQNEESLSMCKTEYYLNTLLKKCGCLPFHIRITDDKV